MLKQTQEHTLLVWALAFFLVENVDESNLESNFTSTVLQTALNQLSQTNVTSIQNAVLKVRQEQFLQCRFCSVYFQGLERILIVKKGLSIALDKQVLNVALEKLKNNNSNIALPGLQLLLSYTYTGMHFFLRSL